MDHPGAGMGVLWFDVNADGLLDLQRRRALRRHTLDLVQLRGRQVGGHLRGARAALVKEDRGPKTTDRFGGCGDAQAGRLAPKQRAYARRREKKTNCSTKWLQSLALLPPSFFVARRPRPLRLKRICQVAL